MWTLSFEKFDVSGVMNYFMWKHVCTWNCDCVPFSTKWANSDINHAKHVSQICTENVQKTKSRLQMQIF